jgi:hypothetical protein
MFAVGLVVEGIYDEAALTELIRKCHLSDVEVICRPCGSANQLMKKFPGFLESFRHGKEGGPVDKAIVVRDADHKDVNALIARMESRVGGRIYPFSRHLLAVVQELETWLLADEGALALVTGRPQRGLPSPESLHNPKVRLERILSDVNIVYTAEIARKIAAAASVDVLANRCPSFRRFQKAVVNA